MVVGGSDKHSLTGILEERTIEIPLFHHLIPCIPFAVIKTWLILQNRSRNTSISIRAVPLYSGILGFFMNWAIRYRNKAGYVEVRLKQDQGTIPVLLKISSLHKQLLLPEEKIKKAFAEGKLESLVYQRFRLLTDHKKTLDRYMEVNGELQLKGSNTSLAPLTFPSLLKAMEKTRDWMKKKGSLIYKGGVQFNVSNQEFVAVAEQERVHILHWSKSVKIENGTTGTVSKVFDLVTGVFKAVKIGLNSENIKIVKGIEREYRLLRRLAEHSDPAPIYINVTKIGGVDKIVGFVGTLYDGDLFELSKQESFSASDRILCCKQLIHQLEKQEQELIGHGDIKPENILWRRLETGEMTFKLIDYAGAKDYTAPYFWTEEDTVTPEFILEADMKLTKASKGVSTTQSYRNAITKRDVYALGLSFFEILTGLSLSPGVGKCGVYAAWSESALTKKGYPLAVNKLIRSMLHKEASRRPAIKDLAKKWSEIEGI